jgi:hypothetical protein
MTENVHTPADPGITWTPCPRCQGEGGFAVDTLEGVTTVGCSAPGCLDGHVAREVTA